MSIIDSLSLGGNYVVEMGWPTRATRWQPLTTLAVMLLPRDGPLVPIFRPHLHLIIQINPAPMSAQDQLPLLSLPYLSPALPALASLHDCPRQLKEISRHPSAWEEQEQAPSDRQDAQT